MNRVGSYVGVTVFESDIDDSEVMNVVKIITNRFFGHRYTDVMKNEVSGSTSSYFMSDMAL